MNQTPSNNPFYKTISNLLSKNDLIVFGKMDEINKNHEHEVLDFLKSIYTSESLAYPNVAPSFNKDAASWSSKILFYSAQLIMYREHSAESLTDLFPKYKHPKSVSAVITSDLCLRYLPGILKYLEQIDIEDQLIPVLKNLLTEWHYSGLLGDLNLENVNLELIVNDECLRGLYINRIIENKRKQIGQRGELKPYVLSALGNYKNIFWSDFN